MALGMSNHFVIARKVEVKLMKNELQHAKPTFVSCFFLDRANKY